MERHGGEEVLTPGGRWGWLEIVPATGVAAVAGAQAVQSSDDGYWWILALITLGYAVALLTREVHRALTRQERSVRVDDAGLTLPGHGTVAWSQVEHVTTVVGDKASKFWHVRLRDGPTVRTALPARDQRLRQRWDDYQEGRLSAATRPDRDGGRRPR